MLRLASLLLSVAAALQHTARPPNHRATRLRAAPVADPFALSDTRPIVLYDGVCRMCNFWVDWVLANDREKNVRFCALQSDVGRALLERSGRRPDDISSIVLSPNATIGATVRRGEKLVKTWHVVAWHAMTWHVVMATWHVIGMW